MTIFVGKNQFFLFPELRHKGLKRKTSSYDRSMGCFRSILKPRPSLQISFYSLHTIALEPHMAQCAAGIEITRL